MPDRLLTTRDVAERLSVCPATVRRRCQSGELGHVRVGGGRSRIRIAPSQLDAWLRRQQQGAGVEDAIAAMIGED